jgi:apolipoprotein N-acyltransferase
LPLAASQWERPLMLQSAAYVGAWGVSFVLIFFNIAIAAYFRQLGGFIRERRSRFCPEFYAALVIFFVSSFGLYGEMRGERREPLFRAGFVQPYIPQDEKWDAERVLGILEIIRRNTVAIAPLEPEVIFWPEAVTPIPLIGAPGMQQWTENLAREVNAPILLGAVSVEDLPDGTERWHNAAFLARPDLGLHADFYRKRHLVPFGEYVPFRRFFPWAAKFVPIGGDFVPGDGPRLLPLPLGERMMAVGSLICYEDVFPWLARASVKEGASFLYVGTNNAWYGEGSAAYQHAAHSVLRAVETRRPVLRSGNGGWSGWIDEYGRIRGVITDDQGTVYFRGASVLEIERDARWKGRMTPYVRYGDWFVGLAAALAGLGGWLVWRRPAASA